MLQLLPANQKNLQLSANLIKSGNLVAFPTETVYGLGANALDALAVTKIFQTKGRPTFNPLIVHFKNLSDICNYYNLNEAELLLANMFWPGPLTLILNEAKSVKHPIAALCSSGLKSQAVRIPSHPVALELLNLAGVPIAAPSANKSNKLSPTLASHVEQSLSSENITVLDGGKASLGIESTIIEVINNKINILRYGSLDLQKLTSLNLEITSLHTNTIKAPGGLHKHYSPNTTLKLNTYIASSTEALLAFGKLASNFGSPKKILNLSESGNLNEAAANLFTMLWELDNKQFSNIAVMPIPLEGLGFAINERLTKAAAKD